MKVVIDAVGIRSHGGAAVLRELLHWLPSVRPDWTWHVFLSARKFRMFDDPGVAKQVTLESIHLGSKKSARLLWVNFLLQKRVKAINANVIFSFANMGAIHPVRPQVIFCQQPNAFFKDANQLELAAIKFQMFVLRHAIIQSAYASKSILVQTEAIKEKILSYCSLPSTKMHVIPSGYPTVCNQDEIRDAKKKLIDDASDGPRLLYVSAVRAPKNHKRLISAFSYIAKIFPKASLLLTADPEEGENSLEKVRAQEVQRAAVEHAVADHIVWLGFMNAAEVNYAYKNSHLLVFPSLTESFGLPLVEAMAENCLIAASNLSYAHDVTGDAAMYFDPYDENSIADCVIKILQNAETQQALLLKGQERKKRFNYARISEEIAAVLEG